MMTLFMCSVLSSLELNILKPEIQSLICKDIKTVFHREFLDSNSNLKNVTSFVYSIKLIFPLFYVPKFHLNIIILTVAKQKKLSAN